VLHIDQTGYGFPRVQLHKALYSLLALGVEASSVCAVDVLPKADLACRRRERDDTVVVGRAVGNDCT
jgi:hypothetical protein